MANSYWIFIGNFNVKHLFNENRVVTLCYANRKIIAEIFAFEIRWETLGNCRDFERMYEAQVRVHERRSGQRVRKKRRQRARRLKEDDELWEISFDLETEDHTCSPWQFVRTLMLCNISIRDFEVTSLRCMLVTGRNALACVYRRIVHAGDTY